MDTEIEATFPDVEVKTLRQQLQVSGAKLVQAERLMRRKTFDYPDQRLRGKGGWIRVRDEGDKVTLAYKQLNDRTLHGTQEISLKVEDFDRMTQFLETVGFQQKSYQETKREEWLLGALEVAIDTWPWIPTYVELEGPDEAQVKSAANQLGLSWPEALFGSVENVYQKYYDVTEDEVDGWTEILFGDVPADLEAKRR